MGRYYPDRKATAEESCDLTIFQLKRYGMLKGGHTTTVMTWTSSHTDKESRIGLEVNMTGEPYARLTYSIIDREGNATPYDSKVERVLSARLHEMILFCWYRQLWPVISA